MSELSIADDYTTPFVYGGIFFFSNLSFSIRCMDPVRVHRKRCEISNTNVYYKSTVHNHQVGASTPSSVRIPPFRCQKTVRVSDLVCHHRNSVRQHRFPVITIIIIITSVYNQRVDEALFNR